MKRIAFMFPGQGSQKVGMGKAFYDESDEVKQLYEAANDALQFDLKQLMFEGPQEDLTLTENAQPALLLSSYAAYMALQKAGIEADMVLGHSLGEYSALTVADTFEIKDALRLVQKRGQLMEAALPKGQGTMAAVLGLSAEEIEEVIQSLPEEEVVNLANLNCPGQIVISGSKKGIDLLMEPLKEKGARRVLPLNVSGPFHSSYMKAASEEFAQFLEGIETKDAKIPVYANVTAEAVQDQETIKQLLVEQLYSSVRFEESIRQMIDKGIDAFVEVGEGNVLCGLVRKIDRKTKTFAVNDQASLDKFITWYKGEE
ncbi:MAG TPA: ACP S-malonyltransferase [Pseudogracilibacillus sp.]|nr:ACP S-malonyltransferase [Pseudogracilibacillus sp.]